MKLSIIIPIYNESAIIPELHERLSKVSDSLTNGEYELIFVNDGSVDASLAILKAISELDQHVKYISFSRNFGHQPAVMSGLDVCKGKRVVIIDGDLQDPPELIVELWNKMDEGYKVVYAQRKSRAGESWFKKVTAKLFYRILQNITSVKIPLDTGDFRMMDEVLVRVLKNMPERNKYIRGQVAWAGFKQTFVLYDRQERVAGSSNYPLSKMLKFALDGITSFSSFPLKLATFFGFMVSIGAFVVIIYALFSKYVWHNAVPGWTSLMVATMFVGGIQLISLGVIGEYLGRMNDDIKQRPLYLIEESNLS